MYIKRETCDIWTLEKHLFFDISYTNIGTLIPSLYQYVETHSIEVFWLLSQPLPHLRFNSSSWAKRLLPRWNRFKQQTLPSIDRKHFFMNILCIDSFCLQKSTQNRMLIFGCIHLKHGRHLYYWKQPLNMRIRAFYLDYYEAELCCYLMIHIGNVTSMIAVLHPFVTYLLTLSHIYHGALEVTGAT
jgi:hypothetical protein